MLVPTDEMVRNLLCRHNNVVGSYTPSRCADRALPAYTLGDAPEQGRVQPLVGVFRGSFPYVEGLELPAALPHDVADQGVASRRQLVDVRTVDEDGLFVLVKLRPAVVLAAVCCSSLLRGAGWECKTYETVQQPYMRGFSSPRLR